MSLHQNTGSCSYCRKIMGRYLGFSKLLAMWFEDFQAANPVAHISCAGRGRQDQEACLVRGASKAHYGKSAHNANAAIDIFVLSVDFPGNLYPKEWFDDTLAPSIPPYLEWYGAPGAQFPELPHIEIRHWHLMNLPLVEP